MSQAPTHQQIVQWYRDRPEAGRGDAIRFYRGWIGGNDNERAWKEARSCKPCESDPSPSQARRKK